MRRPYNWCSNYDLCGMLDDDNEAVNELIRYELEYRHTEARLIDLQHARSGATALVGKEIRSTVMDEEIERLEKSLEVLAVTIDRMAQEMPSIVDD